MEVSYTHAIKVEISNLDMIFLSRSIAIKTYLMKQDKSQIGASVSGSRTACPSGWTSGREELLGRADATVVSAGSTGRGGGGVG